MTKKLAFAWFPAALVLAAACSSAPSEPEEPGALGFQTEWLTDPAVDGIPEGVNSLRVERYDGRTPDFSDEEVDSAVATVTGLSDMDENGRDELVVKDRLVKTGAPFHLVVEGYENETGQGPVKFVGHVGPITLSAGERRFVRLRMYPTGSPCSGGDCISELPDVEGLVMPTATALQDGRVLIAGGFETMDSSAPCPGDAPADSICIEMRATDKAFLFDHTTGRIIPVPDGMLRARGGHTATVLPDGRVLIAGGAARAMLILAPEGPMGMPSSARRPELRPMTAAGMPGGHATFEIFDPTKNPEPSDPERDGDPGRGRFVGGPTTPDAPGPLNDQRFMHAATPVPDTAERVLLVGGSGLDGATQSWEVYDDERPGGYGVHDNTGNMLQVPRALPAALTFDMDGSAWIVGGSVATGDADLAEVWRFTGDPADVNGVTVPASDEPGSNFPAPAAGVMEDRPEFALLRPHAVTMSTGMHGLVLGHLGPRCNTDGSGPIFGDSLESPSQPLCRFASGAGAPRSFTFAVPGGTAQPARLRGKRAFAGLAKLDSGEIALIGGIGSADWNTTQNSIEMFSGALTSSGGAEPGATNGLVTPRAMPAAAPLPNGGLLIVGGFRVATSIETATPLASSEILFVQR